jgi:hypothetical protein
MIRMSCITGCHIIRQFSAVSYQKYPSYPIIIALTLVVFEQKLSLGIPGPYKPLYYARYSLSYTFSPLFRFELAKGDILTASTYPNSLNSTH